MAKTTVTMKLREEIKELKIQLELQRKEKEDYYERLQATRREMDLREIVQSRLTEQEDIRRNSVVNENDFLRKLVERMVVDPEVLRLDLARIRVEGKERRKYENHQEQLITVRQKRYGSEQANAAKKSSHIGVDMANTTRDMLARSAQGLDKLGRF